MNVHAGNYNKCILLWIDLQCRHSKFAPLRLISGAIRAQQHIKAGCGTINIIKASVITISLQIAKIIGRARFAFCCNIFVLICTNVWERVCADSPSAADQQRIANIHYTRHGRHALCYNINVCLGVVSLVYWSPIWCRAMVQKRTYMHDFHANQLIPSESHRCRRNIIIAARHPTEKWCGQSAVRAQERSPALWLFVNKTLVQISIYCNTKDAWRPSSACAALHADWLTTSKTKCQFLYLFIDELRASHNFYVKVSNFVTSCCVCFCLPLSLLSSGNFRRAYLL